MREDPTARLPFTRPLAPADCPTCGARPLAESRVAEALDRLSRAVRDAEASGAEFLAPVGIVDAREIIEAARRGVRPVRP